MIVVAGSAFCGLVMGHEICGAVVELGHSVPPDTGLALGDVVLVYPWRGCASCEVCRSGQSQLCENNRGTTTEIGQGPNGGGYGSYVAVPEWGLLVKLPRNIPPQWGAMLPCSALTAYSAILRMRPNLDMAISVRGSAHLLVVGCGGLGLWVVSLVKHVLQLPNVKVVCADTQQAKLDTATQMGADVTILVNSQASDDDTATAITASGKRRIDGAVDFVGLPKTTRSAFKSLHNGGIVVIVGLSGGAIPVSLPIMISKTATISGVRVTSIARLRELVKKLSDSGPTEVIPPTEVIQLSGVNEALVNMRNGTLKGRYIIQHQH